MRLLLILTAVTLVVSGCASSICLMTGNKDPICKV